MDWSLFWFIGLTLFAATTVVRVAGFGGSLVSMPLLVPMLGLPVATPVMTLFGITNFSIVIGQQWRNVTVRDIWRLAIMSILMVPLGIYLIYVVPEWLLRLSLGAFCCLYALYRLFQLPFPQLKNPNWAWLFGAFAGVASGAFSLGGVPTVIYADTQTWAPERFRLNMFSYFLLSNIFTLASRIVAGQITRLVIIYWLGAIPFLLCGLWLGQRIAQKVDRDRFQKLVLVMLILLGGRLAWSAL